jgi:preprotein translocase subunit SecD
VKQELTWKVALILAVVLVFFYGIFGIPRRLTASGLHSALLRRIHLGLDLEGGSHLVLQVQVADTIRSDARQAVAELTDSLRHAQVSFASISIPHPRRQPGAVLIQGVAPAQDSELREIVARQLPDFALTSGANSTYTLTMNPAAIARAEHQAVTQSIETIRNRIDQLGVTEPAIERYATGQHEILVELPGVSDPARVKAIIKSTAMLEIRQVLGGPYSSPGQAFAAHNGVLPEGTELMPAGTAAQVGSAPAQLYYLVAQTPAVTGRELRAGGASVSTEENGRPDVTFSLTTEGGRKFAAFTGSHIGDQLAVVLDNKVMEAATIEQKIRDQGRITGDFTTQAARDLALVLNSGALPASIRYLEESTIGPSLGADSIRDGIRAAVVGMIAVLIFMLVYYRRAGINADVALLLNLVILLGFLGFSHATLTLPGIAGVILTVGMGVDSNVLIFERIREELRNGKTPGSAVDQGFAHAWRTILDTHVTTIVSAAILFLFGTGPVKGFAVTLTFGLLANLFTAVFVSRTIFEFSLSHRTRGQAFSI